MEYFAWECGRRWDWMREVQREAAAESEALEGTIVQTKSMGKFQVFVVCSSQGECHSTIAFTITCISLQIPICLTQLLWTYNYFLTRQN